MQLVGDFTEIDHGSFAGLSNREIEERHPGELARRAERLYTWRFPGGESYEDADGRAREGLGQVARPVQSGHESSRTR